MHRTRVPAAILCGVALCLAGTAGAQSALGDNPPTYQSIGMLDTMAHQFSEADCRLCHDSGVPDRHHVLYEEPIPPGSLVPFPDADGDGNPDTAYDCLNCHDPGFNIVRDCLVCHDAGSPHHTLPSAVDLQCTNCHGDLVDNPFDGHYVPAYSPSLVTPYRGLDGDGYENLPWPTPDLASDGSGIVVPADVTVTAQGPPFFAVTNIGPLGTVHTRTEPNRLSFKPNGANNDFTIASTRFNGQTFSAVFTTSLTLGASWNAGTQTLNVRLATAQTAADLVNVINAATGAVDVIAELGFDGDDPGTDMLASDHYEPLGGAPANDRGFGAGSCSYCHDTDGVLDANGDPDGLIWDNHTLHHEIGLPSLVNDGAGGTMSKCDVCHERVTVDQQSGPVFDLAIRYCERCHGPDSLHNIQSDSPNPGNIGTIVVGGEDAGYGHVGRDAGSADSDCWGCHGFSRASARALEITRVIPTISASDPAVVTGGQDTTVVLVGSGFTNETDGTTYESDVRLTAADGSSVTLTPKIVDHGRMSVTIPGATAPGNYDLRAVKEDVASNPVVVSVTPEVIVTGAVARGGIVTINGGGFGGYGPGSGTSVTARVTTRRGGVTTAGIVEGDVVSWSDTTIVAAFVGRPKHVTVNSVYGTATFSVDGRSDPPGKPRRRR